MTVNSFAVCAFRFLLSRGTYVHLPSQENEIYSHPKRKNRPFILIKRTAAEHARQHHSEVHYA